VKDPRGEGCSVPRMESAGCCDAMAEGAARSRRAAERSEAELRRRRRRGEGVLLDGGGAYQPTR
jgi:hypothetical protein